MRTVREGRPTGLAPGVLTGVAVGLAGQVVLLGALAATVGLTEVGWASGIVYGLGSSALLARALDRAGAGALAPADWVTLSRAVLVGGVTALVAESVRGPTAVPAMVALATAALLLDAVDGWTARRTTSASDVGARFDMEVDAFMVLVLSVHAAALVGPWVLSIGAARYLFVAAGWALPWLRGQSPPRYWGKVVAAIQGIVLTVTVADVLPRWMTGAALVIALGLLVESFGRQIWWLWRLRPAPDRSARGDADGGPVEPAADAGGDVAESASDAERSATGPGSPDEPVRVADPAPAAARRSAVRRAAAAVTTVLAALLVWFALVAPNDTGALTPGGFLRIPAEALVVLGLILVLPGRIGRIVVTVAGGLLGLLTVLKLLDFGFFAALDRPFDPLSDWTYLGPAVHVLGDSIGQTSAVVAVIAAAAVVLALVVAVPLAVRRLTGLATRNRPRASRAVVSVAAAWIACAAVGLQLVPGVPVAGADAAQLTWNSVGQIRSGLADQQAFEAAIGDDSAGAGEESELLSGLRGKDVAIVFVESYGRVAVQDPAIAPGVDAVLDEGTRRLAEAGFSSRSAFLASPTFGGISWLAHATLHSGLWVNSQRRYDQLLASDRFTLSGAFARAGWRTVLFAPANTETWPEATSFYRFDEVYDIRTIGYRGPEFGFATPPDQFTLAAFQRAELAEPGHAPVMAEIDLLSSHTPWAPLPRLLDWDAIGDGSVFDGLPEQASSPDAVWDGVDQIRTAYGQSIEYSLSSLISFVQTHGDDDLVLLVVGDHQPARIVTGTGADHDVPVTLIARDPAVIDRIATWGWQAGLNPGPDAPVWPMDSVRDRFLDAFGG